MSGSRRRIGTTLLTVGVVTSMALVGGCSDDSDDPGDPPGTTTSGGLDRIDGPATVDPSYDPFTTDG